jgi:hypothetical protein
MASRSDAQLWVQRLLFRPPQIRCHIVVRFRDQHLLGPAVENAICHRSDVRICLVVVSYFHLMHLTIG